LNTTDGTIQLASTLTDPKIQNISTIVTLTNEAKTEKYSNDIRSDLNLRAILPTSLPGTTLNETLASSSSPVLLPPSAENGENQDDSNSNSDEE
jgi:hypothetical protein